MSFNPKISVIIPALKDAPALQNLITQLNHQSVFEIILVQSNKGQPKLTPSPHYNLLSAPQGRGAQIQTGLNRAKGDIIWLLHADSELPKDAVLAVKTILEDPKNAMGCFPLTFNAPRHSLRFFAWMSRFETALTTFGDQGFFFRSNDRASIPNLIQYPLLEDVILRQYFKRKGRIKKAQKPITTDAKRFLKQGIWQTQWRNGWILLRFYFGASPQKLYHEYYDIY